MKIDNHFPERMSKISGILFFNFHFLDVDISLIMHNPCLKLYKCVEDIAVERENCVSDFV